MGRAEAMDQAVDYTPSHLRQNVSRSLPENPFNILKNQQPMIAEIDLDDDTTVNLYCWTGEVTGANLEGVLRDIQARPRVENGSTPPEGNPFAIQKENGKYCILIPHITSEMPGYFIISGKNHNQLPRISVSMDLDEFNLFIPREDHNLLLFSRKPRRQSYPMQDTQHDTPEVDVPAWMKQEIKPDTNSQAYEDRPLTPQYPTEKHLLEDNAGPAQASPKKRERAMIRRKTMALMGVGAVAITSFFGGKHLLASFDNPLAEVKNIDLGSFQVVDKAYLDAHYDADSKADKPAGWFPQNGNTILADPSKFVTYLNSSWHLTAQTDRAIRVKNNGPSSIYTINRSKLSISAESLPTDLSLCKNAVTGQSYTSENNIFCTPIPQIKSSKLSASMPIDANQATQINSKLVPKSPNIETLDEIAALSDIEHYEANYLTLTAIKGIEHDLRRQAAADNRQARFRLVGSRPTMQEVYKQQRGIDVNQATPGTLEYQGVKLSGYGQATAQVAVKVAKKK